MIDPLKDELRALARELQGRGIPLIIGGGYGLVLRTGMIAESGSRTLIPDFPSARSTEDLDIFLKAEVISDPDETALGALRLRKHARGTGYALSRERLDFFLDSIRQLMA